MFSVVWGPPQLFHSSLDPQPCPSYLCMGSSLGSSSPSILAKDCHIQEALQVAAFPTAFPEYILFACAAPLPLCVPRPWRPHQAWVGRGCRNVLGIRSGLERGPCASWRL